MELKVFGSSSKGNCYFLGNSDTGLIIEAGIPFRKKVMPGIDFKIASIKGVLISHSHGDHSKRINELLSYTIPAYASKETIQETGLSKVRHFHAIEPNKKFKIDEFTILPFELKHDVRCFGYLIHHKETGWILFATDTYYIPKRFKGLSHILIECNYDNDILNSNVANGVIPGFLKHRIRSSHMDINTVLEMLSMNDLSKVNNIVLLHLSDQNSDPKEFKKRIKRQTGKPTYIAEPGLNLELHG